MGKPRPLAACDHVASGQRPHKARGLCDSCYTMLLVKERGTPKAPNRAARACTAVSGFLVDMRRDPSCEPITGAACPVVRCPRCRRRIGGDNCKWCAPDRVQAHADDVAAAAWARGMEPSARPVLLRSEVAWATWWVLAHGWAEGPNCATFPQYCATVL